MKKDDIRQTGHVIYGIPEYSYKDVRYLYKAGQDKLICSFSSIASPDLFQKYSFVKRSLGKSYQFLSFLDTPAPADDPRGEYYIDKNGGLEYIKDIVDIVHYYHTDNKPVLFTGTSKGGTGAILTASLYGAGDVIVNVPQFKIMAFLQSAIKMQFADPKNQYVRLLGHFKNLFYDNAYQLDNFVSDVLKQYIFPQTAKKLSFYVTSGILSSDDIYGHALPLVQELRSLGCSVHFKFVRGIHNDICVDDYQRIVSYWEENGKDWFLYAKDYLKNHFLPFYVSPVSEISIKSLPYIALDEHILQEIKHHYGISRQYFINFCKLQTVITKNQDYYMILLPSFFGASYKIEAYDMYGSLVKSTQNFTLSHHIMIPTDKTYFLKIYIKILNHSVFIYYYDIMRTESVYIG